AFLLLYLRAKASRPRQGSAPASGGRPAFRPAGEEIWSAGWGCPSGVGKGGGRSRRRRPGDTKPEGHPHTVPRRRISAALLCLEQPRKRPPRGWPFPETVVGETGFEPATSTSRT